MASVDPSQLGPPESTPMVVDFETHDFYDPNLLHEDNADHVLENRGSQGPAQRQEGTSIYQLHDDFQYMILEAQLLDLTPSVETKAPHVGHQYPILINYHPQQLHACPGAKLAWAVYFILSSASIARCFIPAAFPNTTRAVGFLLPWARWLLSSQRTKGGRHQCLQHGTRKVEAQWAGWHRSAFFCQRGYCWMCLVSQSGMNGWHVRMATNKECSYKNLAKLEVFAFLTRNLFLPSVLDCKWVPDGIFDKTDNILLFREWASKLADNKHFAPLLNVNLLFLWLGFEKG
ncbi:hypothetical protein DFH09DRAFT_1085392 [Mycena vulgaris]|nr:hypothetical protein DFH09DRAFT_1085392 [Mycena vulgaris]